MREEVEFQDDCTVTKIPDGNDFDVSEGTQGHLVQVRGGQATVRIPSTLTQVQLSPEQLDLLRKPDGSELDLDIDEEVQEFDDVPDDMESAVYSKLEECYDPEIPVNIVELGLVYGVDVDEVDNDKYTVDVTMTLTAQGCGMGDHLAEDARNKIQSIPGVEDADVEIVWDPKWNENMMSDKARQKLGFA